MSPMSSPSKKKRFTLEAMIQESKAQLLQRKRRYSRAVDQGLMDHEKADQKIAIQEAIVEALTWVNNNYEKVRATARNAKRTQQSPAQTKQSVTFQGQGKEKIPAGMKTK